MYQFAMWFCFITLTIFDQQTSRYPWMSYYSTLSPPQLETILHSCQVCANSSADTRLAVRRMTLKCGIFIDRCLNCTEVLEKLEPIMGIHNATRSIESTVNDTQSTVNSMAENVKHIREDAKTTVKSFEILQVEIERQSRQIEEMNLKLKSFIEGTEKEREEMKKTLKNIEEKKKEIEAQRQEISEKKASLEAKEEHANMLFKEAQKKEAWIKKQQAINEEEKRSLDAKREMVEVTRSHLSNLAFVFLAFAILVLVVITCYLFRPSFGSSYDRLNVVSGNNHPMLEPKFDLCHLSMTRERRNFFERVVQPRLAALNIRPRVEYCLLQQPSDFNAIPKAKAFIVHWASQRRSIFSANWTHRGLLRALGGKPFFIMVCDQEQTDPLSDDVVYDDASFSQIQTEPELRDAAAANWLLTYRRDVENLNRAQERALVNWINASVGEGAFAAEFVS